MTSIDGVCFRAGRLVGVAPWLVSVARLVGVAPWLVGAALWLACMSAPVAAAPPNQNLIRDQAYGADPKERLDLCFPQNRAAVRTLVIALHGGGLFAGDKGIFTSRVCGWFTPHGIMVASINYRLATGGEEGAWPQPLADAQLAVRWLRLHAADYGVTVGRICAVGNSSGAQLALFLGALNRPVPSDVAGQLPGVSSGVDCTVDQWAPLDYREPSQLMRRQLGLLFPGAPAFERAAGARAMSPILVLHRGMGPVLIEQGISDPIAPLNQSAALLAVLRSLDVPARMITFAGGHGPASDAWNSMAERDVVPFIENGR